jgi:hypothetical protein
VWSEEADNRDHCDESGWNDQTKAGLSCQHVFFKHRKEKNKQLKPEYVVGGRPLQSNEVSDIRKGIWAAIIDLLVHLHRKIDQFPLGVPHIQLQIGLVVHGIEQELKLIQYFSPKHVDI